MLHDFKCSFCARVFSICFILRDLNYSACAFLFWIGFSVACFSFIILRTCVSTLCFILNTFVRARLTFVFWICFHAAFVYFILLRSVVTMSICFFCLYVHIEFRVRHSLVFLSCWVLLFSGAQNYAKHVIWILIPWTFVGVQMEMRDFGFMLVVAVVILIG